MTTTIIRAQNQIRHVVRCGHSWKVVRSLSSSSFRSNEQSNFQKHRHQQLINEIKREAETEFDPRTVAEIRKDEMARRRMISLKKNESLQNLENIKNYLKNKWIAKSKFRWFIIGPIIIVIVSFFALGPLYVYGSIKSVFDNWDKSTKQYFWETEEYKNPIVGNADKAKRQSWVFQDTPVERLARCCGFGSDWMSQLPLEERIRFWEWPWEDWLMYDLMPMPHRKREYDIPISYQSNPQFKNAEICPDCFRVMLYTSLLFLFLFPLSSFKYFGAFFAAAAMTMLGWGTTGNDPFSFMFATLFAMPDFKTGNKQVGLIEGPDIKSQYLPSMESGNYLDKNWLVWKYSYQRRWYIPYFEKLTGDAFIGLVWTKLSMAGQRHSFEMEREHYIYSMKEIDDHVMKMSDDMKRQTGALDWEYGREYPVDEIINIINTRCLNDKKFSRGRRNQTSLQNQQSTGSLQEATEEVKEEQEIDLFMKSLEEKFKAAEEEEQRNSSRL